MSTITLQNFRVGSDLTVKVRLKDDGVAIDWSTLSGIRAVLYSDAQSSIAGRCDVTVDGEDPTLLVCRYAATKMQYLGVNRIVVSAKYMGMTKTYDKPAFTFVRWTEDQAGEEIAIEDPEVSVEIDVEDVSSSILQEAVDAAFSAADRANEAAEAAEHMVDIHTGPEGKSAYEVAVEEGYTGTEEEWLASLKGPVGETPDISIGTVTTVEPGTPAAASMSGTPEAPVLNLSIPKGTVGATPNFTVGTVTTGQPGTPVVITITGTAEAPVLNVTIPQGLKGDTGVSADYPITIHNGLDSDATDEALAAAQGKILDGKVSQLEAKVTDNTNDIDSLQNQLDNYQPIVIEGDVTNAPDEEDITTDENDLLKFANRAAHTNYLGYVILRKGNTFASQVTVPNTIYEIRYNFDLGGEEFSMPSGCVLRFVGGNVSNGTLSTNPFRVVADNDVSIFRNITFSSSYISNDTIFVDWFDCVADGVTDNYNQFKRIEGMVNFKGGCRLVFGYKKEYAVKTILTYTTNEYTQDEQCAFRFKSCRFLDIDLNQCTLQLLPSNTPVSVIIMMDNCPQSKIHNGTLIGDRNSHDFTPYINHAGVQSTTFEWNYGLYQVGGFFEIYDLSVRDCVGDCVVVGSGRTDDGSFNGRYFIHDCEFSFCGRNAITAHSAFGINAIVRTYIHDVAFDNVQSFNPKAGIDFEFEDGLGNRPYMYISDCVFERCSRRAVSVANNSYFNDFVCQNSVFKNAKFNVANLNSDQNTGRALFINCNVFDYDDSEQIEADHLLGGDFVDCKFNNIRKISFFPKSFEHCEITTTADNSILTNGTVFPQGNSDGAKFPKTISSRFVINAGFMQFFGNNDSFKNNDIFLNTSDSARIADFTFYQCVIKTQTDTPIDRVVTNLNANAVKFIGCNIQWFGDINGTKSIAGYSSTTTLYFEGCDIKDTIFSIRAGNVIANACSFDWCNFFNTSGGSTLDTIVSNSRLKNCIGHYTKKVTYINCDIVSDAAKAKSGILGISGKNAANGFDVFVNCHIKASNFTTPTTATYSEYSGCDIDIADGYLTGAKVFNSIVRSTIANKADIFEDSIFLLNGARTPATKGATADRPSLSAGAAGFQYFDSDLAKMILWNGTAWVNMDGTSL